MTRRYIKWLSRQLQEWQDQALISEYQRCSIESTLQTTHKQRVKTYMKWMLGLMSVLIVISVVAVALLLFRIKAFFPAS